MSFWRFPRGFFPAASVQFGYDGRIRPQRQKCCSRIPSGIWRRWGHWGWLRGQRETPFSSVPYATLDMPRGPFSATVGCQDVRGGMNDRQAWRNHTVLVNSVCGQVPQRKLRQTFSSDQTKLTVAIPIASGPIICWEKESRHSRSNKTTLVLAYL